MNRGPNYLNADPIDRQKGKMRNSLGSEMSDMRENLVSAFRGQAPIEHSFDYLVSQDHRKTTESKRKDSFFCFCVSVGDQNIKGKGQTTANNTLE